MGPRSLLEPPQKKANRPLSPCRMTYIGYLPQLGLSGTGFIRYLFVILNYLPVFLPLELSICSVHIPPKKI